MRFGVRLAILAGIILLSMLVAAGSFYVYLSLNARRIFNTQASALTHHAVDARAVVSVFPFGLRIDGLSVGDDFRCERVLLTVDPASFFSRHTLIRKLEIFSPVVAWRREAVLSQAGPAAGAAHPGTAAGTKASLDRVLTLAHVVVHDGVVKILSRDTAGAVRSYVLERVQLRADNVLLSDTPARTEFFMTASLAKLDVPFVGHFLKMSGWLNWAARDMDAQAQVVDDDGRVGLDVKLASRRNDMTVFGSVHLAGDQGPQADGERSGLVENVALGVLSSTGTDIDADFSFKTRMDAPDIGKVHLSGRITTGLNSQATSGNIVAGLKAVGEELFKRPAVLDVAQ